MPSCAALRHSSEFSPMSRPASRPDARSARSGPKSVSGNTVEARDAAGGRLGATRRAAPSGRQGSSSRLPDVPASRCAAFPALSAGRRRADHDIGENSELKGGAHALANGRSLDRRRRFRHRPPAPRGVLQALPARQDDHRRAQQRQRRGLPRRPPPRAGLRARARRRRRRGLPSTARAGCRARSFRHSRRRRRSCRPAPSPCTPAPGPTDG